MQNAAPPFDCKNRGDFDWTSPEGLSKIEASVASALRGFKAHDFQLRCAAKILSGTDAVCITATGDGKSALIYILALVRKGTISLVICPETSVKVTW